MSVKRKKRGKKRVDKVAQRLIESERLFQEAKELSPYPFRQFTKSFDSFEEYERWRRAQKNPWYR